MLSSFVRFHPPKRRTWRVTAYGYENIRHCFLILSPRVTVLPFTLLLIAICAVGDHDQEEDGVEPWIWGGEARDQTPRYRLEHTQSAMIFEPTILPS